MVSKIVARAVGNSARYTIPATAKLFGDCGMPSHHNAVGISIKLAIINPQDAYETVLTGGHNLVITEPIA